MSQHPAYELFEELGRGVNTVVYRSYDLSLGREVAIKVLDEEGRRDARHRERFLREAQFLAQFEHDNVLRVYSVDTERGWIIMELMKGTLASVIADGPSDPDLVRSLLNQTLNALAFLHEKNKVHGTVRPTNLLINDAGRVKLSEFEQTDVGGELRAPQGSKKYLAPELIRPEFGEFGPPLDLYCLGFTALEMLKGPQFESLFPGTGKGAIDPDIAWLRWHSSPEDLAPTKKLVEGIPDDLAHVLDRMLKKRVADRAQSAQEVLNDLADRPLVAVPIAGAADEEEASGAQRALAPAVVRTVSAQSPQVVLPQGKSPAAGTGGSPFPARPESMKKASVGKTTAAKKQSAHPKFSKNWWNEQLGRPFVLYPLCAVIILGAVWFSFFRGGGSTAAKEIPVTFNVEPDANGLQVTVGETSLKAKEDGTYPMPPGHYAVTFRREGYLPATEEIDVSAEKNTFSVKLEPEIKWIDVVVSVTPADAQLLVDGESYPLANGSYTHKHQEGKPLKIEARRDGYATASQSLSTEDLAKLGNKVAIVLERAKPKLPAALVAKPGEELDSDILYPVRALSTTLGDQEPLEFVLVKPGTYSFGAPTDDRRPNELAGRSVKIEQPFYIATNETTNAQYKKFYDAKGESSAGTRWQRAARKWAEPLNLDPVKNGLPVTNMSPEQAQAFCAWVGGRLPTEIEWESAVRGPNDRGFPYPWGKDEPTRERCRIFHFSAPELGPVPVEQLSAGATAMGLMNTIDNAAEWCQDSEQLGNFILRGCSFRMSNIDDFRMTRRSRGDDSRGDEDAGFRVVIPLDGPTPPSTAASPVSTLGKFDPRDVELENVFKF